MLVSNVVTVNVKLFASTDCEEKKIISYELREKKE